MPPINTGAFPIRSPMKLTNKAVELSVSPSSFTLNSKVQELRKIHKFFIFKL